MKWMILTMMLYSMPDADNLTYTVKLHKDFIITEALVNNQNVHLIIDTGTPELVLNKKYYEPNEEVEKGNCITGQLELGNTELESFYWNNFKKRHFKVLVTDLSILEQKLEIPIHGLLGNKFLKKYKLYLDITNGEVKLLDKKILQHLSDPDVMLKMLNQQLIPCIQLQGHGKKILFGMDTGSSANFIDAASTFGQANIPLPGHEKGEDFNVKGLNDQVQKANSYVCKELTIKSLPINRPIEFIEMELNNKGGEITVQGILGIPFLKNGLFLFDFKKDRLYIWLH